MDEKYKIIKNPEVVIEKRPGPNYFKTPLSIPKVWDTAQGTKEFGGMWYKSDAKSAISEVNVPKLIISSLVKGIFENFRMVRQGPTNDNG